jgi:tartrate-resistant acid phosphatase type 5
MQQMAAAAAANEAQFVMAIGDNFYPRGVKSVNDPLWKSVYEDRVGSHPSLNIPWWAIPPLFPPATCAAKNRPSSINIHP